MSEQPGEAPPNNASQSDTPQNTAQPNNASQDTGQPNNAPAADQYSLSTIDLTDDQYEVEQAFIRNKYAVYDSNGNIAIRGKQKLFKLKEEFPFVTGDDEDAFTVKAGGMLDIAGNYAIKDPQTDEEVVVLDEDLTFFTENWTVRDPETGEALATIESRNKAISMLRHVSSLANLVPNKYDIRDPEGREVGGIDGKFSLKDKYTVSIDDDSTVPKEAVLASACILDALENK